jgi:hypothetical protein
MRRARTLHLLLGSLVSVFGLAACGAKPPASMFPSGRAALERMKATFECARGEQGSAKVDHFDDRGRLRGDVMLFGVDPDRLRFDVVSPFGVMLATLTADGRRFTFFDMKNKVFYEGPPEPCNIARLTQVQIPAHALVKLLRGEAPLLAHAPDAPTLAWDSAGHYVVMVPGSFESLERVALAPVPEDWDRPWAEQRVRVLGVTVEQGGYVHYRAELGDHRPAATMPPRKDPDGIDPDLAPSGPACRVDVPRRIHVEMPNTGDDLRIRFQEVGLNPPLPEGVFTQPMPGGVRREVVTCR